MSRQSLWSRAFVSLMMVNFCSALSFYLLMVKITEYAIVTYGVAYSVAGTMVSVYVIAALFTRMFFGGRIDRWGVKRALFIGSAVNAAAMLLYLVPMGFEALLAVRVVHGFGFAIMSGSAAAGAALVIPRDRYGEGIGYFSMMQALATGIGPFVAILVTNLSEGYVPLFGVSAVIAVLAMLLVLAVRIPDTGARVVHVGTVDRDSGCDANEGEERRRPNRGIGRFLHLPVVPISSVMFLMYLGYSGILSFVTVYADESGLSDAVSLYFVVYAIVILVSRPPVGRRVDRKGENSTIYFCFAALALGFVFLAFAVNGLLLLASAAFAGFGIGATQSTIQAVIARDTPIDELGKANSTFFMSMDLGSGVGPVVIGAFIPVVGYSSCYLALGVIAILAGVLYYFVHGRHGAIRG